MAEGALGGLEAEQVDGRTVGEITLEIGDERDYSSVVCFLPLQDSTKWANASTPFPINQLVYAT